MKISLPLPPFKGKHASSVYKQQTAYTFTLFVLWGV